MQLLPVLGVLLLSVALVMPSTQICHDSDMNAYSIITCGAPGKEGPPGINGTDGAKGEQGEMGPQGPPGAAGLLGPQGDQGTPGVAGLPGSNGEQGPSGVDGSPGPKGEQGLPGVSGPTGEQGPPGVAGSPGTKGEQGPPGVAGSPGRIGNPGPPGPKGNKGDSLAPVLEDLKKQMMTFDEQLRSLQSNLKQQKNALEDLQGQMNTSNGKQKGLQYSLEQQKKAFAFLKGGSRNGDKIYTTNGGLGDFYEARAMCTDAGGQLASPRNSAENIAILTIRKQYGQYLYLGINNRQTEGTFRYLSGQVIYYSRWHSHEPNNNGNEDCVTMNDNGSWNDYNCGHKLLIVCEF